MIHVVGIGPGDHGYGLIQQERLFEQADYILGSERHLEILDPVHRSKGVVPPKKLAALKELLDDYDDEAMIVYLASGDPLIYGLGKWLFEKFGNRVKIHPGISAMQYLASRIALPMNDAYLTSSHAKQPNFDLLMSLPKVFMVTDQQIGPFQIAQEALKREVSKVIVIGENLSYEDEMIIILPAEEVEDREYKMNVVVVLDEGFGIY